MNTFTTFTTSAPLTSLSRKQAARASTVLKQAETRALTDLLDTVDGRQDHVAASRGFAFDAFQDDAALQAQLDREKATLSEHIMKYREQLPKRQEDKTQPGMRVIRLALKQLLIREADLEASQENDTIPEWVTKALRGQSVPHASAARHYVAISHILTNDKRPIESVLASLSRPANDASEAGDRADYFAPLMSLALHSALSTIGQGLSHHALARSATDAAVYATQMALFEASFASQSKQLDTLLAGKAVHSRARLIRETLASNSVVGYEGFRDASDKAAFGFSLLHHVCMTGLFESETTEDKRVVLNPSSQVLASLVKLHCQTALFSVNSRAMIVPPIPWHVVNGRWIGGYLSIRRPLLQHKGAHDYSTELAIDADAGVFSSHDVLSQLQETPYAINQEVLTTMATLRDAGTRVGKLVPRFTEPKPLFDDIDKSDEAAVKARKIALKSWYEKGGDTSSPAGVAIKLSQAVITTATDLAKHDAVFFPGTLDFRGRMYFPACGIGPQGNDISKGLLTFAAPRPVDREVALRTLKIQIANFFGYDKLSFDARIAFADTMHDRIMAVASDAISAKDVWLSSDEPGQCLAAMLEYAKIFVSNEPTVDSRYIVRIDGTCNGLQHFSALLRHQGTAERVAMTHSEAPADIYSEVATKAMQILEAIESGDIVISIKADIEADVLKKKLAVHRDNARRWLELLRADKKLARKLAKSPTMTQAYGSSTRGKSDQVSAAIKELYAVGKIPKEFFVSDVHCRTIFDMNAMGVTLSYALCRAVDEATEACVTAMSFLKQCTQVMSKADLDVAWQLPDGHRVRQMYRKSISKRTQISLGHQKLRVLDVREADELDKLKSAGAISPNLIHSIDAYHLREVARRCQKEGIMITTIHDSIGTHLGDLKRLEVIVREAFVDIYKSTDFLSLFREACIESLEEVGQEALVFKLPSIPPVGDFDIEQVLNAPYFFH